MRKQLVSYFVLLTSFLLLFVVALIISLLLSKPQQLDPSELSRVFAVSASDFSPEPHERWIYVINTLLAPLACGGLYLLFSGAVKKEKRFKIRFLFRLVSPLLLFLLGYLAVLDLQFAAFDYVRTSSFVQHPWMTLLFTLFILVALVKYGKTWFARARVGKLLGSILYWGAGSLILLFAGIETVFADAEPYVPHIHFVAYFDSVVQVLMGKHLFLDFSPQYGAYAWLLRPLFSVIGLNVLTFTVVMGILKVVIFGCLLALFYNMLENKLIAFLSFATLFFYTRMRLPVEVLKAPDYLYSPQTTHYPGLLDPYFQYNPHRMLFPVVVVFLSWFYITSKNSRMRKLLYFFNSFLSALAILWNPDTGLVTALGWFGLLAYQEMEGFHYNKLRGKLISLAGHTLTLVLACGIVFGSFALSTYLETGFWPSFAGSAEYTNTFYFSGFYMMPMPVIHPWNMVILAYLTGIYFAVRTLINSAGQSSEPTLDAFRARQPLNQFIFLVTIIGIGLFNYYVGRSHDYNLIATVWPGYILLAIFVEMLSRRAVPMLRSRLFDWKVKLQIGLMNPFQFGLFLGLFFFLGSAPISIAGNLPAYWALIQQRLSQVRQGMPEDLTNEIQFIKDTSSAGESVFIISDYAPELYLYTGHVRPVNVVGFGEIILVKDVDQITEFLGNPPKNAKLYWDKRFYVINHYTYNLDYRHFPNLVLEKVSPDSNLALFTPGP